MNLHMQTSVGQTAHVAHASIPGDLVGTDTSLMVRIQALDATSMHVGTLGQGMVLLGIGVNPTDGATDLAQLEQDITNKSPLGSRLGIHL